MGFDIGSFSDYLENSGLSVFSRLFGSASSLLGSLMGIAAYVLFGLAVMKMGEKLGIKNPWLSWIPFARSYAFGKVSETPDKPRKTGKALLTLNIVLCVLVIITVVLAVLVIVFGVLSSNEDGFIIATVIMTVVMLLALLGMIAVAIAYSVVYYMAFYRICKLFGGDQYMTYFLLGFIPAFLGLGIATYIALMVLSTKEPNVSRMFPFGFDEFGNVRDNRAGINGRNGF